MSWPVLHPDNKVTKVTSLYEALQPKYDALYAAQPDISFAACELGYFSESKGPQEGYAYQRDGDWSYWA